MKRQETLWRRKVSKIPNHFSDEIRLCPSQLVKSIEICNVKIYLIIFSPYERGILNTQNITLHFLIFEQAYTNNEAPYEIRQLSPLHIR
jgi:hypothetical protein